MKRQLDVELREVRQYFHDKKISYVHKNKETYQLEISVSSLRGVDVPRSYQLMSQTKSVKRFWTPEIKELVGELEVAKENRENVLKDVTRVVFEQFCKYHVKWSKAVKCLAQLDCLGSLALTSKYQDGQTCRPEFVEINEGTPSVLEIRGAVHPAIALGAGKSFIPNDTVLGTEENKARFVIVSGPNMGGKSTLLRQTCACVIMAQLGCYVPAESVRLSPIDRIFTRVGANDRIMQGQSTFLVELEETANILRHATSRSLVILDELGRGTSTFDGTAIAFSVIRFLSQQVDCLTLFSTHYHMLMEEYANDPLISMYHMACRVDPTNEQTDVTFLYKFIQGTCPKSYGMNVAHLAGLPEAVVQRAVQMSDIFETRLEKAHQNSMVNQDENEDVVNASDITENEILCQLSRALKAKDWVTLKEIQNRIKH